MTIAQGQIWEDKDIRRIGRTFKISNIDDDIVTCEILTGVGGKSPNKNHLVSFINKKRFDTCKYYKLKTNIIKDIKKSNINYKTETADNFSLLKKIIKPNNVKYVITRPKTKSLEEKCKDCWKGNWKTYGPIVSLNSNDKLEVNVRQTCKFPSTFDVKIKLDRFHIYNEVMNGKLEDVLAKAQKELLKLNVEINQILFGEKYYD